MGPSLRVMARRQAAAVSNLWGGDADLGGSTKTIVPGGDYSPAGGGRNVRFGIREHAMGSIANGMLYHGGVRPFVSTFFVFSDYMRPAIRLAALNGQPAIYVLTHDSVGLGEDGPTHQPVEHLMALRAMPNLAVVRPADANETAAASAVSTLPELTRVAWAALPCAHCGNALSQPVVLGDEHLTGQHR